MSSIFGNYIVSSHGLYTALNQRTSITTDTMNKYKQALLIFFFLMASAVAFAQNGKQYFTHKVKKGETLYSLAIMYDTTVDAIKKANPGKTKILSIDQILKIPQASNIVPGDKDNNYVGSGYIFHTVKVKETLYGLGKEYGLDYMEICQANPGLLEKGLKIGEVIVIPVSKKENKNNEGGFFKKEKKQEIKIVSRYKTKKGETIDEICEKHGILKEDFIKVNPHVKSTVFKKREIVNIPEKREKVVVETGSKDEELSDSAVFKKFREQEEKKRFFESLTDDGKTRIAVILPFMLDRYSPGEQARMVEFYEGMLMAVYRLKNEGFSFEINTYDSGHKSKSLDSLINSGSLDKMDMIIGAYYANHNTELAEFAKEKEIPLVIPFSNKQDEIFNNPMVYTVNAMQSYIMPEVAENLVKMFPDANIIFVKDTSDNKKNDLVNELIVEFDKHVIPHTTVRMEEILVQETGGVNMTALKELKRGGYKNIIIPTSASEKTLHTLAPALAQANYVDSVFMSDFILFGYPEWQKHAQKTREQLYVIDTYFYSNLFSHYSMPEASQFQSDFIRWYNRPLNDIIPRFGMLGYDVGYYFIYAINAFGKEMPYRINEIDYTPLQTGFKLERVSNWGGLINKKVYFIHYDKDYNIKKIDLDKCQEEIVIEEEF